MSLFDIWGTLLFAVLDFHFYSKLLSWRYFWFVFVIQCGFACFHMSTQACDLLTFGIWTIKQSLMFSLSNRVRYLNSKPLWTSPASVSLSQYLTRALILAIPLLCVCVFPAHIYRSVLPERGESDYFHFFYFWSDELDILDFRLCTTNRSNN